VSLLARDVGSLVHPLLYQAYSISEINKTHLWKAQLTCKS